MNRRGFLGALTASPALLVLPAAAIAGALNAPARDEVVSFTYQVNTDEAVAARAAAMLAATADRADVAIADIRSSLILSVEELDKLGRHIKAEIKAIEANSIDIEAARAKSFISREPIVGTSSIAQRSGADGRNLGPG